MNKCGTCIFFTGAGDYDICCMEEPSDGRRLTYYISEACEKYKYCKNNESWRHLERIGE